MSRAHTSTASLLPCQKTDGGQGGVWRSAGDAAAAGGAAGEPRAGGALPAAAGRRSGAAGAGGRGGHAPPPRPGGAPAPALPPLPGALPRLHRVRATAIAEARHGGERREGERDFGKRVEWERGQSGRAAADGEDRCFALQCGSCPCNFCAVCLHDCGTDAHAHVATCGETGVLGWVPPPRSLSVRS